MHRYLDNIPIRVTGPLLAVGPGSVSRPSLKTEPDRGTGPSAGWAFGGASATTDRQNRSEQVQVGARVVVQVECKSRMDWVELVRFLVTVHSYLEYRICSSLDSLLCFLPVDDG